MSEQDTEELDSTNQPTEEVVNTEEVNEDVADTDSEDLGVLQEKNKRLFERAKKAEAEAKLLKAERLKKEETVKAKPVAQTEFDLEDVAVLVQKVSSKEDRELVKDYAKFKKVSLEDALNNPIVQAELKDRTEKRQTANATSTGTARRGSTKPTDDQILSNVEQGKFPENPEDLAEARFSAKRKK